MYSLKLSDGTILDNLELNGNNYISDTIVPDEVFLNNLGTVVLVKGDTSITYRNMKLIQNIAIEDKSWFVLAEKSEAEIENENLKKMLADLTEIVLLGGM